jgi:hypothetical protein
MDKERNRSNVEELSVQTGALKIVRSDTALTATSSTTSSSSTFGSPPSFSTDGESSRTPLARQCSALKGFEDVNVSPGSLKATFDEVQEKIFADGILDENFVTKSGQVSCIYYLYGLKYAWGKNRDERIEAIRKCVQSEKFRERLRRIAISDANYTRLTTDDSFDAYFRVASSARMFFSNPNANGGFPKEAILRIQKSANCYLPAACVWYTLQCQVDLVDDVSAAKPLDIAYVARHYIIKDDAALEKRVIENRGGSAVDLAARITGRASDFQYWHIFEFGVKNRRRPLEFLRDQIKRDTAYIRDYARTLKSIGIVGGFRVAENFRAANAEPWPHRYGYWRFDGDSVDTEGVFVHFEPDGLCNDEYARLGDLWKQQTEDATKRKEERRVKMEAAVPSRLFHENSVESNGPQPSVGGDSGIHSMVLLGTYKEDRKAQFSEGTEEHILFMLLNWWSHMPLVLVSPGYLTACDATVYYLKDPLTESKDLKRKEGFVCECSFEDGGEDVHGPHFTFQSGGDEE